MSHFTGKVYDLTQENFQKVIAELEEAKESLRIAVEALEHIANNGPMAIDLLKQKGEKTPAFDFVVSSLSETARKALESESK